MTDSILVTKLFIPPARPEYVLRPRLIEQLDNSIQSNRKLTLISAPAGYGKTALVSDWIDKIHSTNENEKQDQFKIGWLSLDESDSDLARFLTYFIATLNQSVGSESTFGRGVLSMLKSSQPPPTEVALTPLINEIATNPARIILVLDDYQLIDAQPVHEALSFLLDNIPPQMHLVMITREDPPLPLSRLRARGKLTELRATDLRFTLPEIADFLNRSMSLNLSADDIAALERRTEGWITGLQLAAISMRGSKDAAGFIKSFTGSHRFVLDYLIAEVLEQQPDDIQSFLLQTSILDRLNASLCDTVTGEKNSQATLEMLEQANLFIISLDEERCWYRYHQLFDELLHQRLKQTQSELLPALHQRASEWYSQNGFPDEAIDHALSSKDYGRAAQLIELQAEVIWGRGEHRKLQGWLSELPESELYTRPSSSILQARYQCISGQINTAQRTLNTLERMIDSKSDLASDLATHERSSLPDPEILKVRGRLEASRALISSFQGDVPGIIQHANEALVLLPEQDLTWRAVAANLLGNAYGFKGDMTAAYEARFNALKACQAAGDVYLIMTANLQLAITLREQGKLQAVEDMCEQQMQYAHNNGLSETRLAGYLLSICGEALAELNKLDEAIDKAKAGFRLTEQSGDMQMIGWSFMCLIRVLLSRGEWVDAEETFQTMENYAQETQLPPWIADQMGAWKARLWLAQDQLQSAVQWASQRDLSFDGASIAPRDITFFSLFDYLVLSRILIAQERLDESTRLLGILKKAAAAGGRTSKVIEILILQALVLQAQGSKDRAIDRLEQALTIAEPNGFVRIFIDEGQPMAHLLYESLSYGIAPTYANRLLAAFPSVELEQTRSPKPKPDTTHPDLIEPLSMREIEVLQLISEGLTNQEIAARLYLSLNTIKVHTRNIYGKLGVNNRTQAVSRATALGILSSI